jgi:NADH-quinone oxidoreductase subunit C
MAKSRAQLVQHVKDCLGDRLSSIDEQAEPLTVEVEPADLLVVCQALRDDEQCRFEQLSDLSGVDYLGFGQVDWETESATSDGFSRGRGNARPQSSAEENAVIEPQENQQERRFAVVYHLLSVTHNHRLRLRTYPQGEPPKLSSVLEVWASANWYEREAFDLFGILFDGHPDLRRLLTDYGFIGHPFRKDFPLEGNVEVRYDPDKRRVVYQPVSIENRVLVPRVIRNDGRVLGADEEDPGSA